MTIQDILHIYIYILYIMTIQDILYIYIHYIMTIQDILSTYNSIRAPAQAHATLIYWYINATLIYWYISAS